ncbi:hypothetical protein [Pseudorhodoferax sp.]|uniref:hypothetical protein n=1 Tax=Pseudorhodoferax sp. TaxID=1993553 RepID=UPI002DD61C18|nr:hypothetical protein [Pseudorhodoferax sp.]
MKADSNHSPAIRYAQYDWGDLIEATKEQLQALGLGVDLPFPGEPGGPKRKMRVKHAMGYDCAISNQYSEAGVFVAHIHFPNWPDKPGWAIGPANEPFPGVQLLKRVWGDEYVGSAADLVAAGLVQAEQLPGQPGMRKVRVTILPDGTVPTGPPTANLSKAARQQGGKQVSRRGTKYEVSIFVSDEERERRRAIVRSAEHAWELQVRSLPRPTRLDALIRPAVTAPIPLQRHLRLVWSAA